MPHDPYLALHTLIYYDTQCLIKRTRGINRSRVRAPSWTLGNPRATVRERTAPRRVARVHVDQLEDRLTSICIFFYSFLSCAVCPNRRRFRSNDRRGRRGRRESATRSARPTTPRHHRVVRALFVDDDSRVECH